MTGGRIKRAAEYLDDTFLLTYGDGVSNVNLTELLNTHRSDNSLVTLTAVQPPGRFGALALGDAQTRVKEFQEKHPGSNNHWLKLPKLGD